MNIRYPIYEGVYRILTTKRFKKELDAQRKTVFRSTLFPADKRLVKGSNMEELITEIAYLIKL